MQNAPYNIKSMNGTICLQDGNGTTIQDGNIITNDINADNHTSNTIQCDNIIRLNNPSSCNVYTSGLPTSIINVGN